MGTEPGTFRRLLICTNDRVPASTYGLFPSFVLANIESGAKETILIGIAAADSSLGKGLSPVVETVDLTLKELLRRNDLDEIPKHEFHVLSFNRTVFDFPLRAASKRATRVESSAFTRYKWGESQCTAKHLSLLDESTKWRTSRAL